MRVALFLLLLYLLSGSCRQPARNAAGAILADSSVRRGQQLASLYCQSCHQLPEPSLLNKRSWERGVLPAMGPRLGIFQYGGVRYPSYRFDPYVGSGFYPSRPLMPDWQWQEIIDYYSGESPDSIPLQPKHQPIGHVLPLFRAVVPEGGVPESEAGVPGSSGGVPVLGGGVPVLGGGVPVPEGGAARPVTPAPVTCYVHVDTSAGRRQVFVGRLFPGALIRYDPLLRVLDSIPVAGGIVDMQFSNDGAIACNIGNINPNNARFGAVYKMYYDRGGKMRLDSVPFLRDLARPVQVVAADLNGDGRTDYLVCEFGNLRGALSWMEDTGKGGWARHLLRAQPGAIKAYVQDANGDGRPDIWALFAQGEEGIFLFTNKGHGRFEEREVLRFPAVYGSSYFELADLNKDGHPDIVYTCGDNADYSPVLKPYHGVYIYMNDGHNQFSRRFFYPINGCYKAVARDFDGDGDLDLAVIAYFADYARQPEEGFVYLENRGREGFIPYTVPEARSGRWLTMDAGDIDGDGRVDLVLGNFSAGPSQSKKGEIWRKGPQILVLRNMGVNKLKKR